MILDIFMFIIFLSFIYYILQSIYYFFVDLSRSFNNQKPRVINLTSTTPDSPAYNNGWFAIKSNSNEEIAKILQLERVSQCSWKKGLLKVKSKGTVFLSEPIDGWVILIGLNLGSKNELQRKKESLSQFLSRQTIAAECHFQIWHPHLNCMLEVAKKGRIQRLFVYSSDPISEEEEEYRVRINKGDPINAFEQTILNAKIKSLNFNDFMKVIGAYSIDISTLENRVDLKEGAYGLVGHFIK